MIPPDKVLSGLLHSGKQTDVQNILLRISDRELAICLLYMENNEANYLLSFLPDIKQKRIIQEKDYLSRLNIRYPQYRTVIEDVILRLRGISGEGIRSYVRPRR